MCRLKNLECVKSYLGRVLCKTSLISPRINSHNCKVAFIRTISSHAIIVVISYYSFNPVKFYMESTSSSLISLSMNKWNEQIWVGRTLKYCSLPPMCTVYFYHYQKKFHSFPTITPIKVYNTKRNDSFVSYLQGKRYILTYVAPN